MGRVLVTGASGFIGKSVLGHLAEQGLEVFATRKSDPDNDSREARWIKADLHDQGQLAALMSEVKPTHLLHLAWYVEHKKFWESEANIDWMNTSLSLLRHFYRNGGKRAVMTGTCAEYDWRYAYCSERVTPLRPKSLYSASKDALRRVSEFYSASHDLQFAWLRPFYFYGPFESPGRFVPSVITSLLKGTCAQIDHGQRGLDFLYIKDAASAIASTLASDVTGPVNIGSGVPVTLGDFSDIIAGKVGRPDLLSVENLPFENRESSMLVADISILANTVNWSPMYNSDSGLDETIAWWKGRLET